MNSSTSTHYAIRLPNGKLAHDIPGDLRAGIPEYRTLPDGRKAWLWTEFNQHQAHVTIRDIAETMKFAGAQSLFKEHTQVVTVRITAEIVEPEDTASDEEPAGERGPRTWDKAEDVPPGVRVKPVVGEGFAWERSSDRLMPNRFVQYFNGQYDGFTEAESLTGTWTGGFVEVLS